ncbi:hypothetical protein [Oceanobacillus iheyensis HTE831]|uniref:HTH cro/C1-type domain-containing protein n=1 Tax=Oceanobacillus iheyensis (strain DSM 14371 / CIP 107618 / JCM 11309 / KCTC 3954 / HTE831) TaxID=221109 RepID=Q8ELA1_OCEIH|nr:helix-turn-helix transcriptional regulator [Oceanobacillus iheyensis]BAC15286.1 hypothetical protein [Oceanobacillus iheyensis HTE831]
MVKRQKNKFINDPYYKMGLKLRELREHNKMTISDLAELMDVSVKTISNYENGYNRMTIEAIIKIYRNSVFGEKDLEELLDLFIVSIFDN